VEVSVIVPTQPLQVGLKIKGHLLSDADYWMRYWSFS